MVYLIKMAKGIKMAAGGNTGILNTVGDWIGLDGQFGSGGSNKSYSVGGLADSFSNLFSGSSTYNNADFSNQATLNDFNAPMDVNFEGTGSASAPSGGLAGTLAGAKSVYDIASSLFGMYNTNKMTDAAIDNYENLQRIANANEARTAEQYNTFKADKAALTESYGA